MEEKKPTHGKPSRLQLSNRLQGIYSSFTFFFFFFLSLHPRPTLPSSNLSSASACFGLFSNRHGTNIIQKKHHCCNHQNSIEPLEHEQAIASH